MYVTDRGIEESGARRGTHRVSLGWLTEQLRDFVDPHPEFESPGERRATCSVRFDDSDDPDEQE